MTTKQKTVKDKLKNVIHNVHGAKQFIRAHASMAMYVANWEVELMPHRLELAAFLEARGKDINNFNDVIQHGSLFLTASEDFLRGEFVKENVKLTQAEQENLKEELSDAFEDDKMKDKLMTKAAAVGWVIYDILRPHVDQEKVEELIQQKLAGIRLNLVSKFITDKIEDTTKDIERSLVLADRLEDTGIIINADDTVSCTTQEAKEYWDKFQNLTSKEAEEQGFVEADVDDVEEDLQQFHTEFAKMILECHENIKP